MQLSFFFTSFPPVSANSSSIIPDNPATSPSHGPMAMMAEVRGGSEEAVRRHGRPVGRAPEDPRGGDGGDLQGAGGAGSKRGRVVVKLEIFSIQQQKDENWGWNWWNLEEQEMFEWPKVVEGWTSVTSFWFAMVCRWWNLMCQSGLCIVKQWDDIFLTLWPWWVFQVVTGFLPFSIQSFIVKKSTLVSYLRKHHTTPVKEEFAPNLMVQSPFGGFQSMLPPNHPLYCGLLVPTLTLVRCGSQIIRASLSFDVFCLTSENCKAELNSFRFF